MNHGPLVFLGVFFALATSWFGFVLHPQLQLGNLQQTNVVSAADLYPQPRPGLAQQGLEVYRSCGCAACHSQQVRQSGTEFDLVLIEPGTNVAEVTQALLKVKPGLEMSGAAKMVAEVPQPVLRGVGKEQAQAAAKAMEQVGAKTQVLSVALGPDIARGWGKRGSVARDYLYDYPVQLGSLRLGPDLANLGARQTNAVDLLHHLYNPQTFVKGSMMPPYAFLFVKQKIDRQPSADALKLTGAFAAEPGTEIVPKPEARALVAYLLSLQSQSPIFEAPMPTPLILSASTNAPSGSATNAAASPTPGSTNQPAANSRPK